MTKKVGTRRQCANCPKRAHAQSDLCSDCLKERRLREAASKAGAKVSHNKDGSLTVVGGSPPRVKRGKNVKAIAELRAWIKKADDDALRRFSGQLAVAESLAIEIDNGDTSNASTYRALMDNIYKRVDTIYGTQNLDIIARMNKMIEENAEARMQQGWG